MASIHVEQTCRRRASCVSARRRLPSSARVILGMLLLMMSMIVAPSSSSSSMTVLAFGWFGGGKSKTTTPPPTSLVTQDDEDDDGDTSSAGEERYSRQVYTLGKQAHGRIRSSTVYVDGPCASGLVYEVTKNLVLSGIPTIVLVVPEEGEEETSLESQQQIQEDKTDSAETTPSNDDKATKKTTKKSLDHLYFQAAMDDLGQAYQRASAAECSSSSADDYSVTLLRDYLKRLNPSVVVEIWTRPQLWQHLEQQHSSSSSAPAVLLVLDRPSSTVNQLNQRLRNTAAAAAGPEEEGTRMVPLVATETAGVYGRLLCDLGSNFEVHDPTGETPQRVPVERLRKLDGNAWHVQCLEGEKHDVSVGDVIAWEFTAQQQNDKDGVWRVTRIQSPTSIHVAWESTSGDAQESSTTPAWTESNQSPQAFKRIQQSQTLAFRPLSLILSHSHDDGKATKATSCEDISSWLTPCDLEKSWNLDRQGQLWACWQGLSQFVQRHGRLPTPSDVALFEQELVNGNRDERLVEQFVHTCAAKFTPLQATMGAIAAQEALKAVSRLYTPVQQVLLHDCEEVLPTTTPTPHASTDSSLQQPQPGLRYILGDKLVRRLQKKKLFVVGAGAIGCELLKNLAAMGAGTQGKGKITITDMDTIETSNLSRQLLFRDADLGQFKSVAAEHAANRFNPSCRMEAHSSKVGAVDAAAAPNEENDDNESTGYPFHEQFWAKGVDIVLNALDNVNARLYIDGQCVANKKALVDAGTMGPKGNVQVIVPYKSESYASSVDPPEDAIPLCTLKNFPYAIEHTIQWARDLFDGLFRQRASQANDFMGKRSTFEPQTATDRMIQEAGEDSALQSAREIVEDLSVANSASTVPELRAQALSWAAALAKKLFFDAVEELLLQHPLNSKDEDGEDFWSGARKPPSKLQYALASDETDHQQKVNKYLIEFVRHGARLRMETFLPRNSPTEQRLFRKEEARAVLQKETTTDFDVGAGGEEESKMKQILNLLERLSSILEGSHDCSLQEADFEKDDESNGHVAFITAASNMRALGYGIPPVDEMETRRVAGRIIPAMISTTAFVSSLSCIELIKLVQKAPLERHRNSFINLALPFFAFTAPLPAEETPGMGDQTYTLWDRFDIKESQLAAENGGVRLKTILNRIRLLASNMDNSVVDEIEVSSLSFGPYLLYANFLHAEDENMLMSSIWDILEDATEEEQPDEDENAAVYNPNDHFVDLKAIVEESASGDEFEVPTIRLRRWQ